ncbi:threonine/serine exporter family protein [Streptococcus pneumoniae]|nr:threonine/serine exporter family protein [Streptococcus pneumoniae]
MEESKELNAVIDVIMLAGTILLKSGSEIHRVEDTMIRIAHSQGIVDCNVLAMPAAIFFSIENTNISRMKRVTSSSYNIEKVCDVNQISRQLVGGQIDLETAFKQLTALQAQPLPYTKLQVTLAATLFGFAFSLYVEKFIRIPFVTAFAGAFVFGIIAQFWARYTGFPSTADLIIAGAVMPFVPGIALTNAVRDIMTNHINSGMSKMFESLLITLALGAGTSVALVLMN